MSMLNRLAYRHWLLIIFLLIFAALSYAAAEIAVSQAQLYRYGIEEALAACSVGLLCVGMQVAFFSGLFSSPRPGGMGFLVPAAGDSLHSGSGIVSGSPMHLLAR